MPARRNLTAHPTSAIQEGNARKGYCASAFISRASDIPAVVSRSLPDDEFCTLRDMYDAMRAVERHLLALSSRSGRHLVLVDVEEARRLILTLVLADSAVGLDPSFDPTPVLAQEHSVLQEAVGRVREVVNDAQKGGVSFEQVRQQLDSLPNQHLVSSLLSLIGQRTPLVHSLAGPIDLKFEKLAVREVASSRRHVVIGKVVGGYDESSGLVVTEIVSLVDADERILAPSCRIKLQVIREDHRLNILLAQIAKSAVRVEITIPRIPLTAGRPGALCLLCDLREIEVLEQAQPLATIRDALVQQLHLNL